MKPNPVALLIMAAGLVCASTRASSCTYDTWSEDYNAQALLGATRFDHLKFRIDDSATPRKANLSTLPQLGGAWYTRPLGDRLQCGLESSLLLGFRADKLNYLYIGGGGLYVNLSTSLWMFDLAGGAYANLYLDPDRNVRLYAGGGPLIMYVSYRTDKEFSDNTDNEVYTESSMGLGVYARAGIEFRVADAGMLGFGVRGTWSDVDFSDVGGQSDLASIGIFASFTAGF